MSEYKDLRYRLALMGYHTELAFREISQVARNLVIAQIANMKNDNELVLKEIREVNERLERIEESFKSASEASGYKDIIGASDES